MNKRIIFIGVLLAVIIITFTLILLSKNKINLSPTSITDNSNLVPTENEDDYLYGMVMSSGIYDWLQDEYDLEKYDFQLAYFDKVKVEKMFNQRITGMFLKSDSIDLKSLWGKCVKLQGELKESKEIFGPENIYAIFDVTSIDTAGFDLCKYEGIPLTDNDQEQSRKLFEGILELSKRPSPDIAYDFKLKLFEPAEGLEMYDASGGSRPFEELTLVPSTADIFKTFSENINNPVEIKGYMAWGYAESSFMQVTEAKIISSERIDELEQLQNQGLEYKVYYVKNDLENMTYELVETTRRTERKDIATFLLEELMMGPTRTESNDGLSTEVAVRIPPDMMESYSLPREEVKKLFSIKIDGSALIIDFKGYHPMEDICYKTEIFEAQVYNTLIQLNNIDTVKISFLGNACPCDLSGRPCESDGTINPENFYWGNQN